MSKTSRRGRASCDSRCVYNVYCIGEYGRSWLRRRSWHSADVWNRGVPARHDNGTARTECCRRPGQMLCMITNDDRTHLPSLAHWARKWIYHRVCNARPVRRQTYGYLPRHGRQRAAPLLPLGPYSFFVLRVYAELAWFYINKLVYPFTANDHPSQY